jgi:chromosome segregation ATPase
MLNRVAQLEVERDCCEREVGSLRASVDEGSRSILAEQERKKAVLEENTQLKNAVYQSKTKMRKMGERIRELEDANVALGQQFEAIQRVATNSSAREAGIRTKITSMAQLEAAYERAQGELAHLEGLTKKLRAANDSARRHTEALNQKIARMRQRIAELTAQNGELGKRLAASESEKAKIAGAFEKLDHKLQAAVEQRNQLQESEQQAREKAEALRVELIRVEQDREAVIVKSDTRFKALDSLESRLSAIEDRNQEYQLLMKLIHKTTAPNQKMPASIQTFLKNT